MNSALLAYVPRLVAAELAAHPDEPVAGRQWQLTAVALCAQFIGADVNDRDHHQHAQTDAYITQLNANLTQIITSVHDFGGSISHMDDTHVLALFPYNGADENVIVQRAVACALNIQAIRDMQVGLSVGEVMQAIVGNLDDRLLLLTAGEGIEDCVAAMQHAKQDGVVLSATLQNALGEHAGESLDDAYLRVTALRSPPQRLPDTHMRIEESIQSGSEPMLKPFVPMPIADRVMSGAPVLINAYRVVTVARIKLPIFAHNRDQIAYLAKVLAIVRAYDGYLQVNPVTAIYDIVLGAYITHENDSQRALDCVLAVQGLHERLGLPSIQTGVATEKAFVGLIGSEGRYTYTIIGAVMSGAARLMQAAEPGYPFCDAVTVSVAGQGYQWQAVDSASDDRRLLGAAQRQIRPRFQLKYSLPLVGRERDLATLRFKLDQLEMGQGQMVSLIGEAGIGKTRLGAEIIREAFARQYTVVSGRATSHTTQQDFSIWRDVWYGLFDLDPNGDPTALMMALAANLAMIDDALVARLPLLGAVLGLTVPENTTTRPLDAAQRMDMLCSMLLTILQNQTQPTVMLLEDAHWIDPTSADLLAFIVRNLHELPIIVVVLARPPAMSVQQVNGLPHVDTIQLSTFDEIQAQGLIDHKRRQLFANDVVIPPELITRVAAQAAGNPFFIDELMNYLHRLDLDLSNAEMWAQINVPRSLTALLLARIDQLAEDDKVVLKVASVIGHLFRASWVYGSHPELGIPAEILQRLAHLDEIELTRLQSEEPEVAYLFKHILTQETVYASIAEGARRALHARIGDYLETQYQDQPDAYVDALALHYGESNNIEKQRHYLQRAGDVAFARYSRSSAVYYYERLFPLIEPDQQAAIQLRYAESLEFIGRWDEAETAYQAIISTAEDARVRAQARRGLGNLHLSTRSYGDVIGVLEAVIATVTELDDQRGLAQTLNNLSFASLNLGEFDRATEYAQRQLQLATQINDAPLISDAHQNLGLVQWYSGDVDAAQISLGEARRIAEGVGYKLGQLYSLNNIAGLHFTQGNYDQAMTVQLRAIELAQALGYTQMLGFIIANTALLYTTRAIFDDAMICLHIALVNATSRGDRPGILHALGGLCELLLAQEEAAYVSEITAGALPHVDKLSDPSLIALLRVNAMQAALALNQYTVADEHAKHAIDAGTQAMDPPLVLNARLGQVFAQLRIGVLHDADAALDAITQDLGDDPDPTQQAAIAFMRWRLNPDNADYQQAAADAYQALYNEKVDASYRRRYQQITGELLPTPPSLPPLPIAIERPKGPLHDAVQHALAQLNTMPEDDAYLSVD